MDRSRSAAVLVCLAPIVAVSLTGCSSSKGSSSGARSVAGPARSVESSVAHQAFAADGKAAGAKAVSGLGRGAFSLSTGVSVLLDDTHYVTVSTGLSTNDSAKDIAIANVLLQRLGY
jgi:hypothetical protein